MTAVQEAEVTAVHAPGTDMAPYAPAGVAQIEEYRARIVMAPEEAKALDEQLRECMKAILRDEVDYGVIPGAGDKKNLLKPGAEKLLQWFGFGHRSIEVKIERDNPDHPSGIADRARRIGVTYRTEVTKTLPGYGEVVVATCEGYAGFDEDRYFAPMTEARAKAESKERANAERYQRAVNQSKWIYIIADYRAPWNTLVKMAQKRSFVGAAILATGASGLFTQDMEDHPETATVAAAAAPEDGQFRAEAMKTLTGLNPAIKKAIGAWYRGKNWPDPREWSPDQWCTALQAAGFITGQKAAQAAPAAPPATGRDDGQPGEQPAPAAVPLTMAEVAELGDGWVAMLDEITGPGDREAALARIADAKAGGGLDDAKAALIERAVEEKVALVSEKPAA